MSTLMSSKIVTSSRRKYIYRSIQRIRHSAELLSRIHAIGGYIQFLPAISTDDAESLVIPVPRRCDQLASERLRTDFAEALAKFYSSKVESCFPGWLMNSFVDNGELAFAGANGE